MKIINYRLFFFELVFASLIIFAHLHFPQGEAYIDAFGRTSVLFFFILSGYFYTKTLNKDDYKYTSTLKRCLRLFLMMISTAIIYLIVLMPAKFIELGTPKLFSEAFTWNNLVDFFSNYFPSFSFLWFIVSLIICYLLYPLIYKINWFKNNKLSILIPCAILFTIYIYRIFCNKYDWGFFSRYEVTRNFLFTGLPCFLIGSYIFHHEQEITKIKRPLFYGSISILIGTTMLEVFIHQLIGTGENEFYLSSISIAFLVVLYCIQNPAFRFGEFCHKCLGPTGPTIIYLFHMLFATILSPLYQLNWGVLLIILSSNTSSLLFAFVYNWIKVYIQKEKSS